MYKTKKGLNQRVKDLQKSLLSTSKTYSDDNLSCANIPPLIDFSKSYDVKFQIGSSQSELAVVKQETKQDFPTITQKAFSKIIDK